LLARICKESGLQVPSLTAAVLDQLRAHAFNGNVRELENMLHRAVALGEGGDLLLDTPGQPKMQHKTLPDNLQDYLDGQEREILCRVLEDTRYNRTAAASRLGMSLRQIRYRIARLNIVMPDGDAQDAGIDNIDDAT
jgi:two-component system response regulator PilR (NtrC family)